MQESVGQPCAGGGLTMQHSSRGHPGRAAAAPLFSFGLLGLLTAIPAAPAPSGPSSLAGVGKPHPRLEPLSLAASPRYERPTSDPSCRTIGVPRSIEAATA